MHTLLISLAHPWPHAPHTLMQAHTHAYLLTRKHTHGHTISHTCTDRQTHTCTRVPRHTVFIRSHIYAAFARTQRDTHTHTYTDAPCSRAQIYTQPIHADTSDTHGDTHAHMHSSTPACTYTHTHTLITFLLSLGVPGPCIISWYPKP